jgi:hypothetical protein
MRHDEIEAFKNSITHLEKEIEYLRQQNTQLLNLIAERK